MANVPWTDPELARLYDAFPFDADVPFYLELARQAGGPVLEVGCGTGRLLLPLARAGISVVGVDMSPHMLAVAAQKLAAEPSEVRSRVRLVEADMRALGLGEEFGLAFVPVKTFAYLASKADQLAALAAIGGHLRPGGRLVLDLANPTPEWVGRPAGQVLQDVAGWLDESRVLRYETMVETDLATQVRTIRSVYHVTAPDGTSRTHDVEWPFRFTYRFEAEHLLERSGLEVERVLGGYAGEPFTSTSPVLLLVGRRQPPAIAPTTM